MYSNDLYHHGIKGQKWGVRNGPPYPLKQSKVTIKSKSSTSPFAGDYKTELIKLGVSLVATIAFKKIGKMLAERSAENQLRTDVEMNKRLNTSNIKKRITYSHSEEQDMKEINPDYDKGYIENSMNCTMCTTAYELRRRGYDVRANTTTIGRPMEEVATWFNLDNSAIQESKKYSDIKAKLEKEPEGARGNIFSGVGLFDAYHSMVWEKKNGKIVIRDCQSNELYDSIDSSIINPYSNKPYKYIRTDNAALNWDNLRDSVVERK